MKLNGIFDWLIDFFGMRKSIRLGIYGSVNVGKTTLANRIAYDWTGEEVGTVSEVPHETRFVQKKEKVVINHGGKKISINLLDMPGLSTRIDYKEFFKYGIKGKKAKDRAKEATQGVIEAIKWLNNVDTVLAVMDCTKDPLTQINATLLGNLEAKKIPVIIIANKIDLKNSKPQNIRETFSQYPVIEVSGLTGKNMDKLYDAITKYSKGR